MQVYSEMTTKELKMEVERLAECLIHPGNKALLFAVADRLTDLSLTQGPVQLDLFDNKSR